MEHVRIVVMLLAVVMGVACAASGAAYHVDGNSGSDAGDGMSPASAWRTQLGCTTALLRPSLRLSEIANAAK